MIAFLKKQDYFAKIIMASSISYIWWGLLFILMTCLCFSHIYYDILITAKASYIFWGYFFSGDFSGYLSMQPFVPGEYYIVEGRGRYPIVSKIVMSLWLLPAWSIGKIVGYSVYNTVVTLMWLKLWLFLSCLLSGIKVYDIINKFRSQKCAANTTYLFYSSVLILLNTMIVSQIEIFTCLMMLYGIEGWLDNNRKQFLLFFAVAIGMKYFALLAFLPLLLIKEKRPKKIIAYICIVSITALEILIPQSGGGGNAPVMLPKFLDQSFLLTIMLVLIFAYLYEKKNDERDFIYAILSEVIIWGAFCFFAKPNPYWSVLIVPFITLAIGMSIYKKNEVILMETILTGLLSFTYFIKFYWVYDARTELEMGVLPWLFGLNIEPTGEVLGYHTTLDFLREFKMGSDLTTLISYNVALACMVGFIYILWTNYKNDNVQTEDEKNKPYIYRFVVNSVISMLPVVAFLRFYL